jgi:signal transduction histidine kinase
MLITLATIIFNLAIRIYIEKDILRQLNKIASNTEHTALQHGPDFFPKPKMPPPPSLNPKNKNDLLRYYFMLDHSLKESLTVLNADYILLDKSKNVITPFPKESFTPSADLLNKITSEINKSKNPNIEAYLNFYLSGIRYVAIIRPVSDKNSFGLGWIIIYSSLEKVNQLQLGINLILLAILIFSALVIVVFSSLLAKKISEPFSTLNQHIRSIAERNFGTKLHMPVDDELREFVNNINILSEKLETYDKAQKTFLQNASHEFRTPLMSIQSYAEGIKYNVVDNTTAVNIIIAESKRLTHLVEDLLYLSRLDSIEESYYYSNLNFSELLNGCIERMNGIAIKSNIKITSNNLTHNIDIYADEEKLSRAITNVIINCIRYANSSIIISSRIIDNKIKITISDDGPGFEISDLPNIFERFYKGKQGNFGLGLSISKNVIEKHSGKITAENSKSGAIFIIELPIHVSYLSF